MRISDWSSDVCASDLTMSKTMCQFVAGQLKYADDLTYFLAPYINSYKRFQAGIFAPTKAIWSLDNRTAGFRLCGEGSKADRKSVVSGKSVSVRLDLGGRRSLKKKQEILLLPSP